MIKLTYVIFPRGDLELDEARRRWMEDHGSLMRKHAGVLRVARYVQTPHVPHPLEEVMASARGVEPAGPLGMAEIYWASREDLEFTFEDRDARRAYRELVEDEKRFAAWSLAPWIGIEREVIRRWDGCMSLLFSPLKLGDVELANRVVMAPMTRSRAGRAGDVSDFAAQYYAQRASAGLIVAEAIGVSAQAHGYPFTPGLWTRRHVDGWARVTASVHARGGRIAAQLWHVGRVFSADNNPQGLDPVAPSPVAAEGRIYTSSGWQALPVPRALDAAEVRQTIEDFAAAAASALRAGFDAVELHAANGYLIEQFLSDDANRRDDGYGGSPARRLTFLAEILDAVSAACGGLGRIGVRISPYGDFNGIRHGDPDRVMHDVLDLLSRRGIGFLHVIEPEVSGDGSRRTASGADAPDVLAVARSRFSGMLIAAGGYDRDRAEAALAAGRADLIAFGRPFISNPDLVERMRLDAPLSEWNRRTFYTRGPAGYVDYPDLNGSVDTAFAPPFESISPEGAPT